MVKKKNIKKSTKKLTAKQKQDRQLKGAVILMVGILAIIILVPLIKIYIFDRFEYLGLDFQKTQLGNYRFYSTRIPVLLTEKEIGYFSINFRNDPRKLEDINFKKITYAPVFQKDKVVYISTGKIERECNEGTAAVLTISGFLNQFAQMNVSGALSDKEIAEANNLSYVTCSTHPENTVINIIEGNKTEIRQTRDNCYELEYNECEVLKVSEKFILEIIKGYLQDVKRFIEKKNWWQKLF